MWPTILCAGIVALVFFAIVARGVRNRKRNKGGCGCAGCPSRDLCRPKPPEKP